jgi:hypothetical protein
MQAKNLMQVAKDLRKCFHYALKNLANCEKFIQVAQKISYIVRESKSKSRDFPLNEGDDTSLVV